MSFVRCTLFLALAAAALPAGAECIRTTMIRGYQPLDKENLILRADAGRAFHVELRGFCFGLEHTHIIGYADGDRDGRICPGGLDAIVVRDPKPDTCRIGEITALNESEAAALKARFGKEAVTEGEVEEAVPEQPADETPDQPSEETPEQLEAEQDG